MSRFSSLVGLAWREGRHARRRLLLYMSSISLGVAALVAIDSFGGNVAQSVRDQSRELLGGDVALTSREASISLDTIADSLRAAGHGVARVTSLASMAAVPRTSRTRLVQVRGVSAEWPLYGTVATEPANVLAQLQRRHVALVDRSLLASLGAVVGDTLTVGSATFTIGGVVDRIPGDVGVSAAIAPRVIVGRRYLSETRLLVFGSRSERQILLRASPELGATRLAARLRGKFKDGKIRVSTATQTQENLSDAFDKLTSFLGIVGLVALLLGGVGVASGVHAFVTSKIDVAAVLRCLGATSRQVLAIYSLQAAAMGLIGAMGGTLLGIAVQLLLPHVAASLLPVQVHVALQPRAVLLGLSVGVWVALVFALWPLVSLRRVSPLQTLRRESDAEALQLGRFDFARVIVAVALIASVGAIVLARAESPREGIGFAVAIAVAVGVLALAAALVSRGARALLRARWPFALRHGISSLYRPGNQTRAVMLALGFGVFLVSTLYQVGAMLVHRFDVAADAATANVLFFDVQPAQATGLDSTVRAGGWEVVQRVPIVTMRVAGLNGVPLDSLLQRAERLRTPGWVWRREYRSTWRDTVVSTERIVQGHWFTAQRGPADTVPEVSIDRDVARDMRLRLGDVITWDIQGVKVATRVTSFREVNWGQFTPNFFAVFEPDAIRDAPAQYVLLARVPGDSAVARLQNIVVERWPNISSIDLSLIQRTIEGIVRQMATAVRFLALFSVAMGLPVLFSAVAATRRARMREGVLLKTLGATRAQVRAILAAEYAALGVMSALTGLVLSLGGSWALARWSLKVPFAPAVVPLVTILVGMLALALAVGLLAGRDVFAGTAMEALRES
ncbi:MAG: FtsX-like permease family protein [Gemmatimonadaceae bacterium]|nr:FtsX-like permease family protein [Gemmatimonadaceae bacterium]NUR18105.1 FtsX-like permease family protein [Gemmatimonadaceae bacterium]